MDLIIKFLQFVSRIINKLIPYELQKNNLSNPSGVYKLLVDENDKVTYKILGEHLRQSIPFDNYWKTRDFAINLALLNQRNHSEKLFYLEFGVYEGSSFTHAIRSYLNKKIYMPINRENKVLFFGGFFSSGILHDNKFRFLSATVTDRE